MFQWLSTSSLSSQPNNSSDSDWFSAIDSSEQIVETSNSSVFSRGFKAQFVEQLAVCVEDFKLKTNKDSAAAEDSKIAQIVGAPLGVVIAGHAGLGKSSLVNAVFKVNVAEAGGGRPVTAVATAYNDPTGFARIIDTPGFNPAFKAEDFVRFVSADQNVDATLPHFDMVWYFVDRIHEDDEIVLAALLKQQIPFLVIISKCDAKDEVEIYSIRSQIHSILTPADSIPTTHLPLHQGDSAIDSLIHSLELDSAIRGWDIVELRNPPQSTSGMKCPVCGSVQAILRPLDCWNVWYCQTSNCTFSKELHLKIQDIRSLRDSLSHLTGSLTALLTNIPHRRFRLAHLQTDNSTHLTQIAIKIVATATLTAAGIGAAPIPFADMPFLLATQTTMILSVCRVFEIPALLDPMLYLSILAASPFPFLGILCAGAVKTIPGVGSVAAGVIEAPIAGGMTLAMGIAVLQTCVGIYKSRLEERFPLGDAGATQDRLTAPKEFKFDANVQKKVQGNLKGTVEWVKKAAMGAVGEHIRMAVVVDNGRDRKSVAEVPMLEFDRGGALETDDEIEADVVDVEALAQRVKERNVQPEEVVQALLIQSTGKAAIASESKQK
ncbi:hypothetical protein BDR26DRAFT_864620 [Obelidium mucronatum]|nr:hypothetical protein BDR26DRAFT_864620 [Obelidium mucronatum]